MIKKLYMTPDVQVVKIRLQAPLLIASDLSNEEVDEGWAPPFQDDEQVW